MNPSQSQTHRLQSALAASERRRQAVLDTVLDAIVSINSEGTIETVNASVRRIFGYEPEELIGQNVRILMPEPDHSAHDDYLRAYETTHVPKIIGIGRVVTARRKDGTTFPAQLTVGETTLDGRPLYTGVLHDISNRQRAQAELLETRERLERAINGTSDGIWEYDLTDVERYYYSPRFREMLEIEEGTPTRLRDRVSPEVYAGILAAIQTHIDEGTPYDYLFPCTLPSGTTCWFRSRGKASRDANGKPVLMSGSITDVTAFLTAQEELEQTRERLELAIGGTSDGIWDWHVGDNHAYISPRMKEMLGLAPDSAQTLYDLLTPDEVESMQQALQAHIQRNVPYDHEFPCSLPSGESRWFRARGQVVRDGSGAPVRVVGSLTDVTDRREAMRALEEMAATLSLKVEERTAELRHANSQLQRAARSKDAFLASMSHELRTPLNAVLGLTEALMEDVYGPLNTGQRQALSTVDTSGKHLLALISDVLDLAKIHAGRLSLDKEPIPIRDLVHACVATVRRPAEKKGLHLAVTEIDPRLMVNTDGRRLKQILINLLANAVKFTPNGGRVMLDVRPRSDVQIIEFWVLDTGIGIPADRLEAIFEPFHQIDSKLSREYDGTGLGLALVSELVDAFGGSIAVESEVGRGSQFLVSLPWQETALRDAETVAEDWRPRRALVIEDVSSDAERLVRALDEFGIQTLRIDDTSEALAKIAEYRPDVLFLDIMLPEESGWEFLTRVRYQHNHLPVVVVSVLDDAEVSRAHGAVAHIVKPFAREDLVRALSRVSPPAGHGNTLPGVDSSLVGVKVLLAEDNEANVMAVGDYLRSHGIDLVVARNGQEAVDLALSERPAVILMDVQMPIMDGLQATRRIRAQERDSRVPIVALTALAMSADRERCLVAGADAYLSKPVRLADLLGTIAGFLRRSQ